MCHLKKEERKQQYNLYVDAMRTTETIMNIFYRLNGSYTKMFLGDDLFSISQVICGKKTFFSGNDYGI